MSAFDLSYLDDLDLSAVKEYNDEQYASELEDKIFYRKLPGQSTLIGDVTLFGPNMSSSSEYEEWERKIKELLAVNPDQIRYPEGMTKETFDKIWYDYEVKRAKESSKFGIGDLIKTVTIAGFATLTGGAAAGGFSSVTGTATGTAAASGATLGSTVVGGAVGGAVGGGISGVIETGSLSGGLKGAVRGGLIGGATAGAGFGASSLSTYYGGGELASNIASKAATGLVKGAVATGTSEGAIQGAFTGGVKGALNYYTSGTSGTTTTSGKDMSLWDDITGYFTEDDGSYDWGNIAGTALSAYGAYTQYQGAKEQRNTAQDAADLGQRSYNFAEAQQKEQFGLAKATLANRIMQQQEITAERGQTRDMLKGYLQDSLSGFQRSKEQAGGALRSQFDMGLSDLTIGFDQARGDVQQGLQGLRGAYDTGMGELGKGIKTLQMTRQRAKGALQPLIEESDIARRQQMGLLGIGGYEASLEKTPGYQFRMEEAMRGAERNLSSVGGSRSGRALTELQGRAEGLAGQYFDTHMNQLGQFSQAGINARGQLSGLEHQYGQDIAGMRQNMAGYSQNYGQNQMAGQQALSNLAASRGQLFSGARQQYAGAAAGLEMQQAGMAGQAMTQFGQLQVGLQPRADMFNSPFGQLNSGMTEMAMGGMMNLGREQYRYGDTMGEIYGTFGSGLEDMFGKGTIGREITTY